MSQENSRFCNTNEIYGRNSFRKFPAFCQYQKNISRRGNFFTKKFPTRLIFFPTRLIFFPTRLIFFPTRLIFFTTRLIFFTTRLIFFTTAYVFYHGLCFFSTICRNLSDGSSGEAVGFFDCIYWKREAVFT